MKVIYGDGKHDDTEAIQAYLNGEEVVWPTNKNSTFKITKALVLQKNGRSKVDIKGKEEV